jgi:hypothetical protein
VTCEWEVMSVRTVEDERIDVRQRTCASCGHLCDRPAEFHPHLFCVLKKAGVRDPWASFVDTARLAGLDTAHWPKRPPLARDLRRP